MDNIRSRLELVLCILLLGLIVAIVLAQANPLYQVPNRDSGFFMYAGSQILKGKLLYLDIWDSKGPLIFYINTIALWIGQGSRWGVWGMEFIFLFLSSFVGFKIMGKLWGVIPAIFGSILWLFAFNNVVRGGNFTEEYSLLFSFIAIYAFWLGLEKPENKFYPFIIGATLSINFLFRANNIGIQISIIGVTILAGIFDKNYTYFAKRLLWIGLGILSVLTLVALYFLHLGTLDDMIQAAIFYNFYYSHEGTKLGELFKSFIRGIDLLGLAYLLPTFLGFILLLEKLPSVVRSNLTSLRDINLLLLIGYPVEIILSGLSGNNFPHYYICWSPYIGMLSASLLGLGKISFKKHWFAISFMILLFSITNLDFLGQYRTAFEKIIFNRSSGIELVHPVAKYVRDNTNPEETVLVWGTQPYINLLARRDSPTGILFYPQLADTPFTNNLNDKFYQDLVQNKPVLIVDMVTLNNDSMPFIDPMRRVEQESRLKMFTPPSNLELVFNFIHQNYHLETIVGGVPIYRINENTP